MIPKPAISGKTGTSCGVSGPAWRRKNQQLDRKKIVAELLANDFDPAAYVAEHGLEQINDRAVLEQAVRQVLMSDAKSVTSYKAGKTAALKALIGKVMAKTGGKANPVTVNELMQTLIAEY